jgi:hypothetical protein
MGPCIEGIKNGLLHFVEELQSRATVDYRLRLIAYRDLHDPTSTIKPEIHDFTPDVEIFRAQLSAVDTRNDTQKHRGAESTLDALHWALTSNWRERKTHRSIVLVTDDNSHETLHPSTHQGPDNDVNRIIQLFRDMRHSMLFMVTPQLPIYERIEQAAKAARRDVVAEWIPAAERPYEWLASFDWSKLLGMVGGMVSASSIAASFDDEDGAS